MHLTSKQALDDMFSEHKGVPQDWDEPFWTDTDEHALDGAADAWAYEVTIVFQGALDETFEIATNAPEMVCLALYNDCVREYLIDPDSLYGFSVEMYTLAYAEGDPPAYRMRFTPYPEDEKPKKQEQYFYPN